MTETIVLCIGIALLMILYYWVWRDGQEVKRENRKLIEYIHEILTKK